jgi:glycosyltransferase involved in cell wall biosynthesis
MHILLISRCPPYPLHLGDRLIVYHLARHLSQRGHRIDLLALDDGAAGMDAIAHRHRYTDFFHDIQIFPDSRRSLLRLARRAILPSERFPRSADSAWSPDLWNAARHAASQPYDLVHVFGGISVYEIAGALVHLPRLITPYESYSLLLRREREVTDDKLIARVRLAVARRYESFMFAPYERVVVVSEADAAELRTLNPDYRVEVIPNGVDLAYFYPISTPRTPGRLLFVGNFSYPPNVDAALWMAREVLPLIRAARPDAILRLVGSDPPPELTALASPYIQLTGRVEDVRPEYAAADVFLCGLRVGAGIKNKVLEALAMSCAVVATPISADGIAITPDHHALIAPPDPAAFAAAALRALADPDLRDRLGANGHHLIKMQYSWDRAAQQYEALYQQIV